MTNRNDLLERAARALSEVAPGEVRGLSNEALAEYLGAIEHVGRLVDSLRVSAAAELDDRCRPSLGELSLTYRSGDRAVNLLEKLTLVSQQEAARRIRIGKALRGDTGLDGTVVPPRFSRVADAVESGALGIDAALAITKNLAPALTVTSRDVIDDAEEQLVTEATRKSADVVAIEAIIWREALDPDGATPREVRLREKRWFCIGRTNADGLTPFSGMAEPHFAATLRAAIGERTSPARQPRFLDPADATGDEPTAEHPFAGDGRTREQRAYDVLEGLLTAGIRADRDHTGPLHSTASVSVVVRAGDLANGSGPAWLDDVREPISAALAAVLACDAGTQFIGVGDNGQPLWIGQRERYFTAAQRKALAVRDGGCVFPGCGAPPSWCHAHHVVEWSNGGPTNVDNGALLCGFHHRLIHRGEFRLRMVRGRPELLSPRWVDPEQQWRRVGGARWQRAAA